MDRSKALHRAILSLHSLSLNNFLSTTITKRGKEWPGFARIWCPNPEQFSKPDPGLPALGNNHEHRSSNLHRRTAPQRDYASLSTSWPASRCRLLQQDEPSPSRQTNYFPYSDVDRDEGRPSHGSPAHLGSIQAARRRCDDRR